MDVIGGILVGYTLLIIIIIIIIITRWAGQSPT